MIEAPQARPKPAPDSDRIVAQRLQQRAAERKKAKAERPRTQEELWHDQMWRLHNLYYITDASGRKVKFTPNWAQEELLRDLAFLNVILKARQLGFTTFIDLFLLDACVWQPDQRAAIICHALPDAQAIFRDKVKFPFDNLPDQIREAAAPKQESATELLFANNSSIRVTTSARSGTFQYLHISEYGKLCAQYPEKAREVRTGALNTIAKGSMVFIESTAEGRGGHFYELCQRAQADQLAGRRFGQPGFTDLDWQFHFFPWWRHPEYEIVSYDPSASFVPIDLAEYFETLQQEIGVELSLGRKLWYAKKSLDMGEDMKREFPSTPKEAFEAAVQGAYYKKQMTHARASHRIRRVPILPNLPVNTVWDLGWSDSTAIWLHQHVGMEHRFVGYLENSNEPIQYYCRVLQERWPNVVWGEDILPHDARAGKFQTGFSHEDHIRRLRKRPTRIVERVQDHQIGIEAVRAFLPQCWFDEAACDRGIAALESYRKEWDDKGGTWKSTPNHDWASHGAKAFEQVARHFERNRAGPVEPALEPNYNAAVAERARLRERDRRLRRRSRSGYVV